MQNSKNILNIFRYLSFISLLIVGFSSHAWTGSQSRMAKPPGSKHRTGNSGDTETKGDDTSQMTARSAADAQKQSTATAQNLLEQARNEQNPDKVQHLKMQAARVLISGKFYDQARTILDEININSLAPTMRTIHKLLQAELELANQRPEKALKLATPMSPSAPQHLRIQSHKTRAAIFRQMGRRLESIKELIQVESLISNEKELASIHLTIWSTLQQLSIKNLQEFSIKSPGPVIGGWLRLAVIYKQSILAPAEFQTKLSAWKGRYPQHAAEKTILAVLNEEQKNIQNRPARLALLLPLKGRIGRSATAIRDGFLTAHFASANGKSNITVRIYDTSAHGKNIRGLYSLAVKEGAQFVIGPLRKSNVRQLASLESLPVPVLALNNLPVKKDAKALPGNIYLFGLSPEDEARQIAERAIFENKTRAIAFVPDSRWGGRVLHAFANRYKELGGNLLEQTKYLSSVSDYSRPLKRLLNLDEAEARHKSLHKLLRVKDLAFEPRRRQDADFIFLAAYPRQARLIGPQLRYHDAADIPLYTTSHIYQGVLDVRRDADVNDMIFCDTPWTLSQTNANPYRQKINKLWPNKIIDFSRLYALGVDAYNVIPYLKWLKAKSYERYNGQTGRLAVDDQNRIRRTLTWAKFIAGKAVIIQERLVKPTQASIKSQ